MADWWKKSTVYQIYPKSFNDTQGNGLGDIQGIIEKLDYLRKLGVDILWLTPIYDSPQKDNGYDISDYYSIYSEYGTMADFDRLLHEARRRDLKIIMDIVVNHISTDSKWFQEALSSKDNKYRDYFIWKDPVNGEAPNNWKSKFGGSAWEYDEASGQYYLHLFDKTQADLNWENENLRRDIYQMMNYWFQKGVDGFRLDVINLISKDQSFPSDDGSIPPGDGRKFYTDGPRVHEYMQEMNQHVFSKYNSVTVGEMSSTTIEHCIKYTNPERRELDMTFNFHHLKVDYPNGEKWKLAPFDFLELKRTLSTWQTRMNEGGGWNALFWCNHDQPRVVSRYGNDGVYRVESAKMLASTIHMLQGTPYIYQGEEFGMTNPGFSRIEDYRDVETLNVYDELLASGLTDEEALTIIKERSRDNSRTPVQWDASEHAGFTSGTPWIHPASNYKEINAEQAVADENSIFYFYKALIELRKEYDIITEGDFTLLLEEDPSVFAYVRSSGTEKLLTVSNFYESETKVSWSAEEKERLHGSAELLLSNYNNSAPDPENLSLRPYETAIYRITNQ